MPVARVRAISYNASIVPTESAQQILSGDCLQVLPTLPAACADIVFADPPYNLQLENDLYRPNMTKVDAVDDHWDQFASFSEYDEFTERWLSACRRVLSDTGTIWVIGSYHNIYRVGRIMMDLGYWLLNDIVWVKTNPMPNFRGVRFTNAHETLLWAKRSKDQKRYTFNHHTMKRYNAGKQMRSDWELPLCTGQERLTVAGEKAHTTQKPEALLERCIVSSTRVGDTVVDPFFGTGTTGAVAKRLGRQFIGIEQEERYLAVARQRIARVQTEPLGWLQVHTQDPIPPRRVAFKELLGQGRLQPGQTLRHVVSHAEATINRNGTVSFNGLTGSIHAIGAQAMGAPKCNGWTHWLHQGADGEWRLLDELRQEVRSSDVS